MSRPLALLITVGAVTALLVMLSWNGGATPAADATADTTAGTPDVAAKVAETKSARVEVAKQPDSAQPPIPDDAIWLDLRVIDADSKAPVPGASVRWSTDLTWQTVYRLPQREMDGYLNDDELQAERFGWRTQADAAGIARIAASKRGATVHAYAEGRYGTAYLNDKDVMSGDRTLELDSDRALHVQVLEPDGRPAIDVEVGIAAFDADGSRVQEYGQLPHIVTAAPDGIAEFRHLQRWPFVASGTPAASSTTYRVATRVPGLDDPGVAFDFLAPPASPVVLHLPPTGRLRTRLMHRGQPLVDEVWLMVWQSAGSDLGNPNRVRRARADDDGWARFRHVGLGGTLTVTATLEMGSEIHEDVAGPVAPGQEISFDLDADSGFLLTGSVIGPDGKPLAHAILRAEYDAQVTMGATNVKVDAQGAFLLLLGKGYTDKATLRRFVLSRNLVSGPPLRVSVPTRKIARGVNDLGVLQLSPGPLLVAGRVVFDPPLQMQVPFRVEQLTTSRGRKGEEIWETLEGFTMRTRDDGAFELRGEVPTARHRLVFNAYEHLPIAPIEFRDGTDDLVVHLDAGQHLEAQLLVPEATPNFRIRGLLVPLDPMPADSQDRDDRSTDRFVAEGWGEDPGRAKLTWPSLPKGRYRLEVHAMGIATPLATVDDIVLPLPVGGDPRLQSIDLRSRTRLVRFVSSKAAEPDAPRPGPLTLFFLPQDDDKGWEGTTIQSDGATFLLTEDQAEVMVASPGFRPATLDCKGDEVRIALTPWPTVEITIANLPSLPDGLTLHLTLTRLRSAERKEVRFNTGARNRTEALTAWTEAWDSNCVVENGRAQATIDDGTFRIGGYVASAARNEVRLLQAWSPAEITGGPGLAPITVQISTEELRQAIDQLQQKR